MVDVKPIEKLGKLRDAADCVCLNETTRTTFEMLARNVFRKYKALFPEPECKPYTNDCNAIEAIYNLLNQNVKSADVTSVILKLQSIVNDSVSLINQAQETDPVYVDLGALNFDQLKKAYDNAPRKNKLTYDLQQAIEQKLDKMLKENPLRLEFYDRYKKIIDEYNEGKSADATNRTFNNLIKFLEELTEEEKRAVKEGLDDNETLAIFDLLVDGKKLHSKSIKKVKKVAKETLEKLKAEKLKIDRWNESRQITAQVKSMIYDNLLWLPEEDYSDEDVSMRSINVYQHIHSTYSGNPPEK